MFYILKVEGELYYCDKLEQLIFPPNRGIFTYKSTNLA